MDNQQQQFINAISIRRKEKTDAWNKLNRENQKLRQKTQEQSKKIDKLLLKIDDLEEELEDYKNPEYIENWGKKKGLDDFFDVVSSLPGF